VYYIRLVVTYNSHGFLRQNPKVSVLCSLLGKYVFDLKKNILCFCFLYVFCVYARLCVYVFICIRVCLYMSAFIVGLVHSGKLCSMSLV